MLRSLRIADHSQCSFSGSKALRKRKAPQFFLQKLIEPDTKTRRRQHTKHKPQTNLAFCIINTEIINKLLASRRTEVKHLIYHDQRRVMVSWGIQELFRGIGHHVSKPKRKTTSWKKLRRHLEKKIQYPLLIETFSQNERGNLVDLVPGQQPALCSRA